MNWLTRLIPSIGEKEPSASKSKVPDGLWNNCPACESILYQPELEKSLFVIYWIEQKVTTDTKLILTR